MTPRRGQPTPATFRQVVWLSPSGSSLSRMLSRFRHCHRFYFHLTVQNESTFLRSLRSTSVTTLQHYYGRSDSCSHGSSAQMSMNTALAANRSPCLTCTTLCDHSVSNHPAHFCCSFDTLPVSSTNPPKALGVKTSPFPCRLVNNAWPNRVRHPTDWSLASCCSPPHLAVTQLQSATGRRAYT